VGKPILEQVEETKINLIWGKQLDEKRMKKVKDLVVFLLFFKKWMKKMKNTKMKVNIFNSKLMERTTMTKRSIVKGP
jgi:hypothetical protein